MKYLLLLLLTFSISAEITDKNVPLYRLLNEKGEEVATRSTSLFNLGVKASKLPDGKYIIYQPKGWLVIKHKVVQIDEANIPPVADAGEDQTVRPGDMVFLPCNLSYDPDGTIVKCEWRQTGGPPVKILYTPTGQAYFIKASTDIKT